MFFRKYASGLLLLIFMLTIAIAPVLAVQTLPAAPWYAVVWLKSNNTLHWLNAQGEKASLARPRLPDEMITSDSPPQMRLSPDGKYLVLAARLNNGRESIGIFSFETGTFVKTHQAQPGETINLGSRLTFSANSRTVAAGFMSGDHASPAWRIITFNLTTGDAVETLNHTDAIAPQLPNLVMPYIVYYNVNLEAEREDIHFQLIPQGTGGMDTVPAYVWSPLFGQVNTSPYSGTSLDILPQTGEMTYPVVAQGFPVLEANGPFTSFNAIARQKPGEAAPLVTVNGSFYHWSPRWAKNGAWILYQTSNQTGSGNWNITEAGGSSATNNQYAFDASIQNAFGTVDGYIFYDGSGKVFYTNGFTTLTAPVIYQAPEVPEVIYVTPQGSNFTLASLADINIAMPPSSTCGTAPATRVAPGMPARVTFTDGTNLRVRQTPGGRIVTQLTEGTTFVVIEGPQCVNNYNWWRIQLNNGLTGWVAEGDSHDYFIEPWAVVTTPLPTATFTLPPVVVLPDNNCSLAPPQSVAVGNVLRTVSPGGTLALRHNPADATPFAQVPDNTQVTIIEGPVCHQGYRLWRVSVVLGAATMGWLSEGTQQAYFLKP